MLTIMNTATKIATPSNHPDSKSFSNPITNEAIVANNKILNVASSNYSYIN